MKIRLKMHKPVRQLEVKQRSLPQMLVILVSFWSFISESLGFLTGMLKYIKYLPDAILVVLLILALNKKRFVIQRKLLAPLSVVLALFIYALAVYLFRYQSVAYFLWGFRNLFRFWIAFFSFVAYLDEYDVKLWFRLIEILFWINAALSFFQFGVLGIKGDYLGGIFGIDGASNDCTTLFFAIIIGKTLLATLSGTEPLFICVLKCGVSLLIAAMAELKFYFFVFIILMVGALLMTNFSARKLIIIALSVVAVMVSLTLVSDLFGSNNFFSWDGLWKYATKENYSTQGDVNRLSAISTLSRKIVTSPIDQIFGLGLGNCDTSSFAVCNTPFFMQYGYMHYNWFMISMVFLEMGYVGLIIYLLFFCVCLVCAYKQYRAGIGQRLYNQLAVLMSVLCFCLIIYNSSLRAESAIMVYFVLALPFMKEGVGSQTRIAKQKEEPQCQ